MSRVVASSRLLARLHTVANAVDSCSSSSPVLSDALRLAAYNVAAEASGAAQHAGQNYRRYSSSIDASGRPCGQQARGQATETSSSRSRKKNFGSSTFEDVRRSAYSEEGDFVQDHIEASMEANVYDGEMAILLAETQAAMNDPGSFDQEQFRKEAELADLEFAIPGALSLVRQTNS